jgi:hypothetical protein
VEQAITESIKVRLRRKKNRGWLYREIEIPTDAEMLRVACDLHEKRVPALTTSAGWPVLYVPLHAVGNSLTYCVFGHECEWQVAYVWRDGDDRPPAKHPERGDVVPMPSEVQGELFGMPSPNAASFDSPPLFEGRTAVGTLSRHERCPQARSACIAHHGSNCCICGFDFEAIYGEFARGFIHVHHLNPIANAKGERPVDPVRDLRPVCPNCHAVLHREEPPIGIDEARRLVRDHSA